MFCMHCGQQLPDEAQFCFKCGNKTFTEKSDVPTPAAEPVSVAEPAPVTEPAPVAQPVPTPVAAPVVMEEAGPNTAEAQQTSGAKALRVNKLIPFLVIGGVALLIGIIIIAVAIPKVTVEIPDPEVYFGLPLSEKSTDGGARIYTYKITGDQDMSAAVDAYVTSLRNDYNFLLTNTVAESRFTNYYLFSMDDNTAEMSIFYNHGTYNTISFRTTKNIGFKAVTHLSYTDTSANEQIADESSSAVSTSEPLVSKKPESNKPDYSELKGRDPAVLPDFTDYDSSGTYRFLSYFLSNVDSERLVVSYTTDDPDASYALQGYIDALSAMGYKYEYAEESTKCTYYLYHPDLDVPTMDYTKGQIIIYSSSLVDSVFFKLPKDTVVIEGLEDAYAKAKAAEDAEDEEEEKDSSSRSSTGGTASLNKDLYDVKSRCGVCGGDGDCNTCGGDGKLHSFATDKENRNCYSCSGRGNCRSCGGDGWVGEG